MPIARALRRNVHAALSISKVYEPIKQELQEVRNHLRTAVGSDDSDVDEIVSYIFRSPGKLLRPALTIFAGRAAMANPEAPTPSELIELATAVELIHNASLVHDDIIDGSSQRRNIRTLNKAYTTRIAVFAGDAIFTQAFSLMTHHLSQEVIEPLTRVTAGMCHAEIINELHGEGPMDFPTYLTIIELKTAALMSAATEAGARAVGAGEEVVRAMALFGEKIGIAYQLIDDYVDGEAGSVPGFTLRDAFEAIDQAQGALARIPESAYRAKLLDMLSLVSEMARTKDMSTPTTVGSER